VIVLFIIDKKNSKTPVAVTVRFDEDLHNQLQETASKEGISFNSLIFQCCRYALNDLPEENNKYSCSN
jgi:predicted HicB family RNase H-like nuclease